MKLVIKYKNYETHVRARLFMGAEKPENIGSLLLRASEFTAFREALEKSDIEITLIEIEDRFQVTKHGPADDASKGIKEA